MFTDQPFFPVGTQCVIINRIWNQDQETDLVVGQLPVVESNYAQDARWRLPAGMKGGHVCNPQWLATGEPFPNDLPPTKYGPFFIPECCGLFQDQPAGGVLLGGEAGDVFTAGDATAGGVLLGGEAGDAITYTDATAGGVEVGGEAGDGGPSTDPTAGGVEVGGEAGDVPSYTDPTAGGVEVGGEAGDGGPSTDPTAGGVEVGGEAGDDYTPPTAPTVRASTNGLIADETTFTYPTRSAGDQLLVWLATPDTIPGANSGWTQQFSTTDTGANFSLALYTTTSDGTDSTLPFTGSFASNAVFVCVSVQDATNTTNTSQGNAASTNVTAPSVTPITVNSLLLSAYVQIGLAAHAAPTITPPGGQTSVASVIHNGGTFNDGELVVASEALSSASATGTRVATSTSSLTSVGSNSAVN